jgi:hypothetical protein
MAVTKFFVAVDTIFEISVAVGAVGSLPTASLTIVVTSVALNPGLVAITSVTIRFTSASDNPAGMTTLFAILVMSASDSVTVSPVVSTGVVVVVAGVVVVVVVVAVVSGPPIIVPVAP